MELMYNTNVKFINKLCKTIRKKNKEELIEIFKEELNKYITKIEETIDTDITKLSNKEYYKLVEEFYIIHLDRSDYLQILSKANNKKYEDIIDIKTTMTYTETKKEDKGEDFSCYKQLYETSYQIAMTPDSPVINFERLTKNQIKNLMENKTILILKEKRQELLYPSNKYKAEKKEDFPSLEINIFLPSPIDQNKFLSNEDYLNIFVNNLRKKITKTIILKELKEEIEELINFLTTIKNIQEYDNSLKLCKEWFDNSKEKETYTKILKKLNIAKDENN